MSNEISNIEILGVEHPIKDSVSRNMLIGNTIIGNNSILTVGLLGAKFKTINDGIRKAIELGVSKTNPITIVIYPGDYNEQIVLNNIHGLSFIGFGCDVTRIIYDGAYPDCVVHVQGDVTFSDIGFIQLNPTTHCVHTDPVDTTVEGTVTFNNCVIEGGENGVGYGSGQNTKLVVNNCVISGLSNCLYAHNCAYAGRTGQELVVRNCVFKHTSEQYLIQIDDAGNTYGASSEMKVMFANNTHTGTGYGKISFRKNTNDSGTWKGYIPYNDNNIKLYANSQNNAGIPGVSHYEGYFTKATYVNISSNISGDGDYVGTIDVPFDMNNYHIVCRVYDIGVGEVTSDFEVFNRGNLSVSVKTKNSEHAGKTFSVELHCSCD